jgi:hypothetical protein
MLRAAGVRPTITPDVTATHPLLHELAGVAQPARRYAAVVTSVGPAARPAAGHQHRATQSRPSVRRSGSPTTRSQHPPRRTDANGGATPAARPATQQQRRRRQPSSAAQRSGGGGRQGRTS